MKEQIKAREKLLKFIAKEAREIAYTNLEPYAMLAGIIYLQIDRLKNQKK